MATRVASQTVESIKGAVVGATQYSLLDIVDNTKYLTDAFGLVNR